MIVQYPDSRLFAENAPYIAKSDPKVGFLSIMVENLMESDGIGVAGPQIGLNLQVFIWLWEETIYAAFNPRFTPTTEEIEIQYEGCLSSPGIQVPVPRWQRGVLDYENARGERLQKAGEGLQARIWQHEIDHLNGLCIASLLEDE